MTARRTAAPPTALLAAGLVGLLAGCAHDPGAQVDAATSSAISMSVRALPAVTGATVTETKTPTDTLAISMTTALDRANPDDLTSATALLRQAADMAYATRHDTVAAVSVTVYGVDSGGAVAGSAPLLAQNTFPTSALATGSR
ncbi:MAG: hypothetical protein ACXV4A_15245 [Actinomycetes bacterium]